MGDSTVDEKTPSHRELPSKQVLEEAGNITIKDKDGNEIPFKSLYLDKPQEERQLIVFVRHFFCGSCEMYNQALGADLPPEKLAAANVKLVIIGCGHPRHIPDYAVRSNVSFPIYAEPSVQLYKKLGMTYYTVKGGPGDTPSYIKKSWIKNALDSMYNSLVSGHAWSAGPPSQNGGEWLFQGGELKWCSRMRGTHGHTETKELKELLGLD